MHLLRSLQQVGRLFQFWFPAPRRRRYSHELALEPLEDRLVPSLLTWTGKGTTKLWSDGGNWSTGKSPTAQDTLVFDSTGLSKPQTIDDSLNGIGGITFAAAGYDLNVTATTNLSVNSTLTATYATGSTTLHANLVLPTTSDLMVQVNSTSATLVLSGVLSNASGSSTGLVKLGGGVLELSAANTYTGPTTVDQGTLQFGVSGALPSLSAVSLAKGTTLDLNNNQGSIGSLSGQGLVTLGTGTLTLGNNNSSTTFSGTISGPGNLIKVGTGTQILSSPNSYSGITTLNSGVLSVGDSAALGTGTLVLNGGTFQAANAGATLSVPNPFVVNGACQLGGNGNNLTLGGDGTLNTTLTIQNGVGETTQLSGLLSGAGGLTMNGQGDLIVAGSNNPFAGDVLINSGRLIYGADNALPRLSNVLVKNGAQLVLDDFQADLGSLSGNGLVSTSGRVLTLGANNRSTVFDGAIQGATSLLKVGTGSLTLTGYDDFTGTTTVVAGLLVVEGSVPNSSITVQAGATLAGDGVVADVTVTAGATLMAGVSGSGDLHAGNVTFEAQSLFVVTLNGSTPGDGYTRLLVQGDVTVSVTLQISLGSSGFSTTIGESFRIIQGHIVFQSVFDPYTGGSGSSDGGSDQPSPVTVNASSGQPSIPLEDDQGVTLVSLNGPQTERAVERMYVDLLHRTADPGGLMYWSSLLDQGRPGTQIAQGIAGSPEYLAIEVQKLYRKLLGRMADQGGLSSWVSFLEQGGTAQELEIRLTGSDEYFAKKGQNDFSTFIKAVYQDALNRNPDVSGAQFWLQQLTSGVAHQSVAQGILASVESDQDMVKAIYETYLRRPVDPSGLANFTVALQNGLTREAVIIYVVGSEEYFLSS
jgi:autotransporter-associated beta strand protein